MTPDASSRVSSSGSPPRGATLLLAVFLTTGCSLAEGPQVTTGPCGDPPPGALPVEEDLFQVPVGSDADGYRQYTLWSCTRLVTTVIWYRDARGGFTTDRSKAVP